MNKLLVSLVLCFAGSVASAATTTVIDFEAGFANNQDITGVDLGGVTLTKGGETIIVTNAVPGGGSAFAVQSNPFEGTNPFRADFTSLVSFFSVDMGDFGPSDDDDLTLQAFASDDSLLASVGINYGSAGNFLATLSVSAPNIAYVVFNGGSTAFPSSIFADNLTFSTDTAVIPLPAGGLLLLTGLGGFLLARRRTRT